MTENKKALESKATKPDESWPAWIIRFIAIPVLVAGIGAYALLVVNHIVPNPFSFSPADTPTQTANPIVSTMPVSTQTAVLVASPPLLPTAFLNNLAGTWAGNGKNILNGQMYNASATVTLSVPCISGNVCGQVYIPPISCSFELIYLYNKDSKFFFQQTNYTGKCGTATLTYLEPLSDGSLLFHSEGDFGIDDVKMTRLSISPTSMPTMVAVVSPQPTTSINDLTGTWSGTINSVDGTTHIEAVYSIQPDCGMGQLCGAYDTPQVGCKGNLIFRGTDGKVFEFIEIETSGPNFCISNGIDRFSLNSNGQLNVSYSNSESQGAYLSSGVLTKK